MCGCTREWGVHLCGCAREWGVQLRGCRQERLVVPCQCMLPTWMIPRVPHDIMTCSWLLTTQTNAQLTQIPQLVLHHSSGTELASMPTPTHHTAVGTQTTCHCPTTVHQLLLTRAPATPSNSAPHHTHVCAAASLPAPVPPLPDRVLLHRCCKVFLAEGRPQHIQEAQLCVGTLQQHEVAEPLLPTGAYAQVWGAHCARDGR